MTGRGVMILALCTFTIAPAVADDDPIVTAARRRQEAVKTLVVEFKTIKFHAAEPGPPDFVPKEKIGSELVTRFIVDGRKARREVDHTEPLLRPPLQLRSIEVCDGSLRKSIMFQDRRSPARETGSIRKDDGSRDFALPIPLALAFFGLDRGKSYFVLSNLRATGETLMIEGAECQAYEIPSGNPGVRFWFDPARDFVLRRFVNREVDRPVRQIDISYREQEGFGWIPTHWTDLEYRDLGTLKFRSEVEVTKTVFNEPRRADEFDVAFPPGTQFHDNRDDKSYEIQPDGSLLEIKAVGVPVPVTKPVPWHERNRWISYAVLVGLLLLLVAMFVMRSFGKKPE